MAIRVLVNGAKGKMGQITAQTILKSKDLDLVSETQRDSNLAAQIKQSKADIVVDFTNADSVFNNTQTIIEAGAYPVIGTSGLLKEQVDALKDQCARLKRGGVIAPNFSLGAILMMKYAHEIAKYFPTVEIIEMHHDKKLDSPSGTAIRSAELIAAGRAVKPAWLEKTKENVKGARGALYQDVPIHAVRLPGLVAHQQIIFGGLGETLTLKHDSIDRESFMPGVLLACRKVMELDHLVYGLEQLL